MKKILCMILSLTFILLLCGCNSGNITNSSDADRVFSQEVTIVKMPSPPKCKTTDSLADIDRVLNVLSEIEKAPTDDNIRGGWYFMIKLTVDGNTINYTVGNVFTDADGKQYNVENWDYIKEKLTEIYEKIDSDEADYA